MDQRTIGVDIIVQKPATKKQKQIITDFARDLPDNLFFPRKTQVKFAGAFPTKIIRISLMISRQADPRVALNVLETRLMKLLGKYDWISSIQINQVNLEATTLKELKRQEKPEEHDIITSLERALNDIKDFFDTEPSKRSQDKLDSLILYMQDLLESLKV